MKLALFRFLDNILNDLLFSQMLLQLIFKVRLLKTGKNYNLGVTQSMVILKNWKNMGKSLHIWSLNLGPMGL